MYPRYPSIPTISCYSTTPTAPPPTTSPCNRFLGDQIFGNPPSPCATTGIVMHLTTHLFVIPNLIMFVQASISLWMKRQTLTGGKPYQKKKFKLDILSFLSGRLFELLSFLKRHLQHSSQTFFSVFLDIHFLVQTPHKPFRHFLTEFLELKLKR